MPIPFRDLADETHSGVAGYLRFVDEPDGKGVRGAMFTMSTRGEPLEFSFTRIDVRLSVLWRREEARRSAVVPLAKVLFEAATRVPDVVLALAEETPPRVFTEDLEVQVPLCRVAAGDRAPMAFSEESERISDSLTLVWVNGFPPSEGPGRKTIDLLNSRHLLLEPFTRAEKGLEEGFSS